MAANCPLRGCVDWTIQYEKSEGERESYYCTCSVCGGKLSFCDRCIYPLPKTGDKIVDCGKCGCPILQDEKARETLQLRPLHQLSASQILIIKQRSSLRGAPALLPPSSCFGPAKRNLILSQIPATSPSWQAIMHFVEHEDALESSEREAQSALLAANLTTVPILAEILRARAAGWNAIRDRLAGPARSLIPLVQAWLRDLYQTALKHSPSYSLSAPPHSRCWRSLSREIAPSSTPFDPLVAAMHALLLLDLFSRAHALLAHTPAAPFPANVPAPAAAPVLAPASLSSMAAK
eukprot:m.34370 g.34370  ORF g.34370 m.34370 type:complete len:292 (+) comp9522_c0_seq2:20-895(+)